MCILLQVEGEEGSKWRATRTKKRKQKTKLYNKNLHNLRSSVREWMDIARSRTANALSRRTELPGRKWNQPNFCKKHK